VDKVPCFGHSLFLSDSHFDFPLKEMGNLFTVMFVFLSTVAGREGQKKNLNVLSFEKTGKI